jgi:hypothetical protein
MGDETKIRFEPTVECFATLKKLTKFSTIRLFFRWLSKSDLYSSQVKGFTTWPHEKHVYFLQQNPGLWNIYIHPNEWLSVP